MRGAYSVVVLFPNHRPRAGAGLQHEFDVVPLHGPRHGSPMSCGQDMALTRQRRRLDPHGPPGTPAAEGNPQEPGAVELPTETVELPEEPNDGR